MKTTSLSLVVLGLLTPTLLGPAHAAPTGKQAQVNAAVNADSGDGDMADSYHFKARTLAGQVEEAIQQGKAGEIQPVYQLFADHLDSNPQIMALFVRYIHNPDWHIRWTLITAAGLAPETPQSLKILTWFAPDPNSGADAVMALYTSYDKAQLLARGGPALKAALLKSALQTRFPTYTYLLLSFYKGDPKVVEFLKQRRKALKDWPVLTHWPTGIPSPGYEGGAQDRQLSLTADAIAALDLALVQVGDSNAVQQVKQAFQQNQVDKAIRYLRFLKFVDNPVVLRSALGTLKGRTKLADIYSVDGKIADSTRLCDTAMLQLSERFDPNHPLYQNSFHHFTDAELNAAYKAFMALEARSQRPEVRGQKSEGLPYNGGS